MTAAAAGDRMHELVLAVHTALDPVTVTVIRDRGLDLERTLAMLIPTVQVQLAREQVARDSGDALDDVSPRDVLRRAIARANLTDVYGL